MKKTIKRAALVILAACLLSISLCSCGQSVENKLVGKWYLYYDEPELKLSIFKDGTYYQHGIDASGYWSLQNDSRLILSNDEGSFYYDIVHLDDDILILAYDDESITFYHSYDIAIKAAQ